MQNMLIKVLVFLALIPSFAMAKDEQPIKIDPLSLYARTVYPEDVKTVGDAARYLLEPTGYQLVVVYPAPKDAVDMYQRKIPPIAKIHRTMPIIDALQILIGNDNWIVIDRNNKLISFSENKS
ncbi:MULTISPECIES: hypothetical protein [Pseudomonas]|uniref:hypothetical protein n=1 Tax=Pseudomonas TaxID=286 RepID=UPI00106BB7E8|nr:MULTISPECIES: hypothetical protein [Pseudomonas]EKU4839429.1 hypothetical protein [Pseudomonas aeruginosa]EKW6686071.1 hypothetical protein [Pseudomonas aeruginosa]EKX0550706.1 hypothetical protein [Pseudomonas aeruginosa]EKX6190059.1 hypothetical protein [Pseudomonas aeruginosa]MBH8998451.1 hypothetical protein [Pseudomonas aeruginosa]